MNTSTPIFKSHKIQHFDIIRETSLFEIANFYEQTHFITKAYGWRNRGLKLCQLIGVDEKITWLNLKKKKKR